MHIIPHGIGDCEAGSGTQAICTVSDLAIILAVVNIFLDLRIKENLSGQAEIQASLSHRFQAFRFVPFKLQLRSLHKVIVATKTWKVKLIQAPTVTPKSYGFVETG